MKDSPPLVLFDIDGTLVRRAGPYHRDALAYGIRRVMGIETTTDGIPVQGMLDPVILAAMLRRAGVAPPQLRANLAAIERAAARYYLRVCPPIGDRLCPGVPAALAKLSRHGALLGLVTGNLTRIGWHKLERAGLRSCFAFGAFGDMAPNRAALVALAIAEARRRGWSGERARISMIGDAPADILAARRNRIRSIAVRTGITPPGELESLAPDFLLPSLSYLRLRMLGGTGLIL
jgi:phosphoglycolate phosphatase-like HAD superfamily hydrolase